MSNKLPIGKSSPNFQGSLVMPPGDMVIRSRLEGFNVNLGDACVNIQVGEYGDDSIEVHAFGKSCHRVVADCDVFFQAVPHFVALLKLLQEDKDSKHEQQKPEPIAAVGATGLDKYPVGTRVRVVRIDPEHSSSVAMAYVGKAGVVTELDSSWHKDAITVLLDGNIGSNTQWFIRSELEPE